MTKRTGHHNARRFAARSEPSPITALRDLLATAFAADIAAITPEICEMLRAMITSEASPAKRGQLRNALVVLARQSGDLAIALDQDLRDRFDIKVAPGLEPYAKTSHLTIGNLPVMGDTRLKFDLALDACARRLNEQTAAEASRLTARVCQLLRREKLDEMENPVAPRVFARSLLESLSKLGFDDETRLEVFKVYGPALLHIAPDLYFNANTLMAERRHLKPKAPASQPATLDRLLSGQKAEH